MWFQQSTICFHKLDEVININKCWYTALSQNDFEIENKDDNLFGRKNHKYGQYLQFIPHDSNKNLYIIRLSLGYSDIFADIESGMSDFFILLGYLHENAIIMDDFRIIEKWWDPSEQRSLDLFLSLGLDWFKEYSNADRLADYYENEWIQAKKKLISQLRPKILVDKYIFKQNYSTMIATPPIHDYYLSLLFYEQGSVEKACHYANKWLDFVTNKAKIPDEPERTLRQIRLMGCNGPI